MSWRENCSWRFIQTSLSHKKINNCMQMYINQIFIWKTKKSPIDQKTYFLFDLFCEYIMWIYNKNQHVSYSINPLCTMQPCTCGLFCSDPGCAPVWSLGRHQGSRPLAPASLEPDWTGWLKPAAHSLRIKPEMQRREETTKLLLVSIITLWWDPIWLLSGPEKNTPGDNYCEIMSGRQAF